jgi:glycosyltransferase involved in cell wall biosynthesis
MTQAKSIMQSAGNMVSNVVSTLGKSTAEADVCLLLEGTYPYVSGGVSSWTHELILQQPHLKFHIVSISPKGTDLSKKLYTFPRNVIGHTDVILQDLPVGVSSLAEYSKDICPKLYKPLASLNEGANIKDFSEILRLLSPLKNKIGEELLLNSKDTWAMLVRMYQESYSESSFLDYFWSWRVLMSGLFSVIAADLPNAKVYHTMSTGYAGLLAARAKIETNRPVILTEHGIYTNERRIEIASADWLEETASKTLSIDKTRFSLRDLWMNAFGSYSRICYESSDRIVTLFGGNQEAQVSDGADAAKMQIIANGVDLSRFNAVQRKERDYPVVSLVGRVVPIKDIKNFIRVLSILRNYIPDVKGYIIGPTDEDREYYEECVDMVEYLALGDTVTFTGKVQVDEYLAQTNVLVLTSISEAQPLVVLEAGACGIPVVATDVGSCRELIMGKADEAPYLGAGGAVVELSNPAETAKAIYTLLTDRKVYKDASMAIRSRVTTYYDKKDQIESYRKLYAGYI